MATEAEVQAAVDGITVAAADIKAHLNDEDKAITTILAWVTAHPGVLPDSLVTQLQDAKTSMVASTDDIVAQTVSITAGTPAP